MRMLFFLWAGAVTLSLSSTALAQKVDVLAPVDFVSADELKAKMARSEPVVIIDVRATTETLESENKIKGAIHVKLRHLRSRLSFPPLKDVPRNREVVTYCACPNDESGIRAAQVLIDAGFTRVRVLKGGWLAWKRINGPVEPFSSVM
jgi:rhodanese-related sulfurtransferase